MTIVELPAEIIAHIFAFLNNEDVFSARLTSRILERASFSYFGKHFFRKKGFMITSPSMNVLRKISEHQELKKYVQHLWFNPDCFTSIYDGDLEASRFDALIEAAGDQSAWFQIGNPQESSRLHELLAIVFRNLPNLTTVGMRRSESHPAYGWSTLKKAVGHDPRVLGSSFYARNRPSNDLSRCTYLFVDLVLAAATSGIKLQRLYTDAVELDHINETHLPPSKLYAACSSLHYLELNVLRGWFAQTGSWRFMTLEDGDDQAGENLVALFQSLPNLKELGLQIIHSQSAMRRPLDWTASYRYVAFRRITTETRLPNLTRIKLENITTTSHLLKAFLQPSAAHLTSLKLRDIRLLRDEDEESEPNPWRTIFTFLATQTPALLYILFYHLKHPTGGVSFVEQLVTAPESEIDSESEIEEEGKFQKYDHITLEVQGRELVHAKLAEVAERHYHHPPLFSYAMDEELWHTDTSDEEW